MLQQKMINFIYIYMYIRENNQESILAYMDYINELFFFFFILEYLYHI